jgi:hypothetical protein
MARDEEYLLYPIDAGDDPVCLRCGSKILLAGSKARLGKAHVADLPVRPLRPVGKVSQRRALRVSAGWGKDDPPRKQARVGVVTIRQPAAMSQDLLRFR